MGFLCSQQQDIENCFINFNSNVWNSKSAFSGSDILRALPIDHNMLSIEDHQALTKPVTKRKVYCTIRAMGEGKSPRLDGLNVEFYLHHWDLIGTHLFKAIDYFLWHASLPNS